MTSEVQVVVRAAAREGQESALLSVVQQLAEESRAEDGCLAYHVARGTEDPREVLLFERWTSLAALEAHAQAPHVGRALTAVMPLLAAPPDRRIYVSA